LDSVVLQPNNLYPGATYYWSNGSVAPSVTIGTTGIGFEIRALDLIVTNAEGCSYYDTVTVIFDFASCSGVVEQDNAPSLLVYPNPTHGELSVRFVNGARFSRLDIIDIHGIVIKTEQLNQPGNGNDLIKLDLSGFPDGTYFIRAVHDHLIRYQKVVVTSE
jgi:hypothetical protein